MGFLNFIKKRDRLPDDFDLDLPPEPPEIGIEEMIEKTGEKKEPIKEKSPFELEEGEFGLPLPPPSIGTKKEKKGFFSLFKPKKAVEETETSLPKIEELEELSSFQTGEMFPSPPTEEKMPFLPPEIKRSVSPSPKLAKWIKPSKPESLPLEIKSTEESKQGFITIDDFKHIQDSINNAKENLKKIDSFFTELKENTEIKECVEWHANLQDIQRKITFIDKILFKEIKEV